MRIVFPREERVEHLPDHEDRGVAGVVVDVFLSGLRDVRSGGLEQDDPVAVVLEDALHQLEMDGILYKENTLAACFLFVWIDAYRSIIAYNCCGFGIC